MARKPASLQGVITEISSEDPKGSGIRKKYVKIASEGNNQHCIEFRGEYLLGILQNFSVHDPVKITAYAKVVKFNQYLIGKSIKVHYSPLVAQ